MSRKREILLLVMVEDAAKLFQLIGYNKVTEKLNRNLERLYTDGRPDTRSVRTQLEKYK
jgi:hypothetical protein